MVSLVPRLVSQYNQGLFYGVALILLTLFVGSGLLFTLENDLNRGSDQIAHFKFIRFIADEGRLPINQEERNIAGYKSDGPPLFHWLVGMPGWLLDLNQPPFIRLTEDDPRMRVVAGHDNGVRGSWVINLQEPYQGEILLWYVARWVTLASATLTLIALYGLLRYVRAAGGWLALSAVAMMAFNPVFLKTSTFTSYEPLLSLIITLYLTCLYAVLHHPEKNWLYLVLGLLLGLSISTKYTPILAAPLLLLPPLWLSYWHRWPWSKLVICVGLTLAGLVLAMSSWMSYNAYHFNSVEEQGVLNGLIFSTFVGDGSDMTSMQLARFLNGEDASDIEPYEARDYNFVAWAWTFFSGLWGGGWLSLFFAGLWLLTLGGLIRTWPRTEETGQVWIILLLLHLAAFTSLLVLRFWMGETDEPMVRHLLPASAPILLLLLIYGLRSWLSSAYLALLFAVVTSLYLVGTVNALVQEDESALPVQSVPLAVEQPLAYFDESLVLLDVHIHANTETVSVDLTWRADDNLTEDFLFQVTLVDAADTPRSGWQGMPVNGAYRTRLWLPGDRVFDKVSLPVTGLPPGAYKLRLQVFGAAGPLLPALETDALTLVGHATLDLGTVDLEPAPFTGRRLGSMEVSYRLWPSPRSSLYKEYATLVIQVQGEASQVNLAAPAGKIYPPIIRWGHLYLFQVQPTWSGGAYRLQVESEAARAETEPLLTVDTPQRQFEAGPIEYPLEVNFADRIRLLGYDLPQSQAPFGESLPVTLYWQAIRPAETNFIMAVRLFDANGQVVWGRDRLPRETYTTLFWAPDEIVADTLVIPIEPDMPPGQYTLSINWYFPVQQAAVSLPLVENGAPIEASSVTLGPIEVTADGANLGLGQ